MGGGIPGGGPLSKSTVNVMLDVAIYIYMFRGRPKLLVYHMGGVFRNPQKGHNIWTVPHSSALMGYLPSRIFSGSARLTRGSRIIQDYTGLSR